MMNIHGSVIERHDNLDDITVNVKIKEEIEGIKKENENLRYLVSKYNSTLMEYQKKHGYELYLEVEKLLISNENPDLPNLAVLSKVDMLSLKKKLVENIAVFQEYEKSLLDKDQKIDALEKEFTRIIKEKDNIIEEKDALEYKNEQLREEKTNLYNKILGKGNVDSNDNQIIDDYKNTQNEIYTIDTKVHNIIEEDIQNDNMQNDELQSIDLSSEDNKIIKLNKSEGRLLFNENKQLKTQLDNLSLKANEYEQKYNNLKEKVDFYSQNNDKEYYDYNRLNEENNTGIQRIQHLQNQLQEKTLELIELEKNQNKDQSNADKLENENNLYKNENFFFKNKYDELEYNKNTQIKTLSNENNELKGELSSLKQQIKIKDDKISTQTFELDQLKQESSLMKSELDHLTQVLEESNSTIQNVSEKEKQVDNIIKNYKKKLNEIILEKEALVNKMRLQENEIKKLTNEYSNIISENSTSYDMLLSTTKKKYDEIIQCKNEEIAKIKEDIISMKVERDRFLTEYNVLQGELNKINNNFHSENEGYLSKYEEAQKKLRNAIDDYENQLMELNIKKDKLEFENNQYKSALSLNRQNEQEEQRHFKENKQKEHELERQLESLKKKVNFQSQENEQLTQSQAKQVNLYKIRINNMKEEYDIKLAVLENTFQKQKERISFVEGKAFDMLKKQENLTEKFKKEYLNTIDYYEGLITYLTEGTTIQGNVSEEDVE